jgi:LDH2 family malate/lactate/ureidoglycolate dehydrogenase
MPEVNYRYYSEPVVRKFVYDYLAALGADEEEASIDADGIVYGALRWYPAQGQGLEKLFRHTKQIHEGGIVTHAPVSFIKDRGAVALLDAAKASGFVAGTRAMRRAVEKAQEHGIGCVLVRHSNHLGTSGYYANMAAERGMIGIAFTNAGPEMAPWGARTPVLGTNPWGLGVPRRDGQPLILDMALTMSGQGMIRWAYREGREIPITWALTADGRRTTNPAEVIEGGTQLPIGDFKGSGLSFMTDVIAGVLSGAKFGLNTYNDITNLDVGHCMIALDIETFMEREEYEIRLNEFIQMIKSAAPIEPGTEIFLPGEMEQHRMRKRLVEGIPVDEETVERLRKMCADINLACPL